MGFESIDQPSWLSEVECNPKMSISRFWLERGGGWGLSPSTSPANHQKLNIIQKKHFIFWLERVADGVWVHWPVWPTSDVECYTKTSISCFWVERGGRWGSSQSSSSANHQKLNIIQKWAFHFLAGDRLWMGFKSIDKPGWSLEVEHNTKMSLSFLWLERVGGWGLSPLTSPANHQKLNVIQKVAFHFFGCRGLADGVLVHKPARLIIRSWTYSKNEHFILLVGEGWQMGFESIDLQANNRKLNIIQKWAFHFFGWRGVADGVRVHWPAWLIIRSWT